MHDSELVMAELSGEQLQRLYAWIDEIPLSRQKKNIARDFSDGVMAAELVHRFFPRLVELHNYPPANSTAQKITNWKTLNRKVFSKLQFSIPDELLHSVANSKPDMIEHILLHLKTRIEAIQHISYKTQEIDDAFIENEESHHTKQSCSPNLPALHSLIPNGRPHVNAQHHYPSHIPRHYPAENKNSMIPIPRMINNTSSVRSKQSKLPSIREAKPKRYTGPIKGKGDTGKDRTLIQLAEKDQVIMELQETIQLLQMKVNRLEHLIRIKDYKLQELETDLLPGILSQPKR